MGYENEPYQNPKYDRQQIQNPSTSAPIHAIQEITPDERDVVCRELNGHVGCYKEVHGGNGIGEVNGDGMKALGSVVAYQLKTVNIMFQKPPNHLVTYTDSTKPKQTSLWVEQNQPRKQQTARPYLESK